MIGSLEEPNENSKVVWKDDEESQLKERPPTTKKKRVKIQFKEEPALENEYNKISAFLRSQTLKKSGAINDPTDPLYFLKSNYYRNNFVQENEKIQD